MLELTAVAGGAQAHSPWRVLPAPPDISFVGLLRPVRRLSLAAKAAEIAPCPDFDKEALIFSPQIGHFGIFGAKQAQEGAKSVPTGHKF